MESVFMELIFNIYVWVNYINKAFFIQREDLPDHQHHQQGQEHQ